MAPSRDKSSTQQPATTTMRALVVLLCCTVVLHGAYCDHTDDLVTIDAGVVRGNLAQDFRSFLGIPFAEPPVGERRWASPVPVRPWGATVKAATEFGKACPQECQLPPDCCPVTGLSEDCLTVNVWTPVMSNGAASSSKLPVMVWIPGGRFLQGTANVPFYDAAELSREGIVVVSMNYRLGALGFLASDLLNGNYALEDQILALHWVKNNIARFGGDPEAVTLAGQSAGAGSTVSHLVNPRTEGLYHRAILMSNPWGLPFKNPKEAAALGLKLVKAMGCNKGSSMETLQCMRGHTAAAIVEKQNSVHEFPYPERAWRLAYPWAVTVDTEQVRDQPFNMIRKGQYNKVPLMIGTVADEARPFVYGAMSKTSWFKYCALTDYLFGVVNGYRLRSMYNKDIDPEGDNRDAMSSIGTDYLFDCPTKMVADRFREDGMDVYSYHFSHALSFDGWGPELGAFCKGYSCHGVELPFMFDSGKTAYNTTAGEEILSHRMMRAWAKFVKAGNPSDAVKAPAGADVPAWPVYDHERGGDMILREGPWEFVEKRNHKRCEWWKDRFLDKGM